MSDLGPGNPTMPYLKLTADLRVRSWVGTYDHEAMGLELPANTMWEQRRIRHKWCRNGWEAALERVLQWMWAKHSSLTGLTRPPSAAVNKGNRPALAAYCENLPAGATRGSKKRMCSLLDPTEPKRRRSE